MNLTDFIFSLTLNPNYDTSYILEKLYKKNPQKCKNQIDHIFDLNFRKNLYSCISINCNLDYDQEEINNIFKRFALFFHKHRENNYFIKREIPLHFVKKYKFGSTHVIEKSSIILKNFLNKLQKNYNKNIIKKILKYHIDMNQAINQFYGGSFVTLPTFDNKNNCKGIVYRSTNFTKKQGQKNLYKFFITHPATYWFPYENINKYKTFFIVEGIFDAIALMEIGIKNVISASFTRLSSYHMKVLENKKLIFIFDNDLGGAKGLQFLYQRYASNYCINNMYICPLENQDLKDMTLFQRKIFFENLNQFSVLNKIQISRKNFSSVSN